MPKPGTQREGSSVAANKNAVKKARAKSSSPLADYLRIDVPTMAQRDELVKAVSETGITRRAVQAAIAAELANLTYMMGSLPKQYEKQKAGFTTRQKLLQQLLNAADNEEHVGTGLQINLIWGTPPWDGKDCGDKPFTTVKEVEAHLKAKGVTL